jgi:hypothetical protein
LILKHSITLSKVTTIVFVSLATVFGVKYFDSENRNNKLKKELQIDKNTHINELNEILNRYDVEVLKNKDLLNLNKRTQVKNVSYIEKLSAIKVQESKLKEINPYKLYDKNHESAISLHKNISESKRRKMFVGEIDSLKNIITSYTEENSLLASTVNTLNYKNRELLTKNSDYENLISKSRNLTATNVYANGIKIVSNNIIETKRLSSTQQIKVCFSLLENNAAHSGNKDIYIQIINPDNRIVSKNDDFVEINNQSLHYSAKTNVFYENEQLDVCVFVDSDKNKLVKGDYEINIFSGANIIGNTVFSLK